MKKILTIIIMILSFGITKANEEVIKMTFSNSGTNYIQLIIRCDKADSSSIWIDLNNNNIKDEGEDNVGLTYKDDKNVTIAMYAIKSNEFSIYGKVQGINILKSNINSLDLSACSTLTFLVIMENSLLGIDLSKNINLEILRINGNIIKSLDLSNNPKLIELSVTSANLKDIIFCENPIIEELYLNRNQHTSLELSKLKNLKSLQLREKLFT